MQNIDQNKKKNIFLYQQHKNAECWIKKVIIKNHTCYYFDGINEFKDFNLDNILLDENSIKKWFRSFHTKLWIVQNLCILASSK